MSKQNDLDKIFAIHLLANAMIFIFEDLPETSKFFLCKDLARFSRPTVKKVCVISCLVIKTGQHYASQN